MEVISVVIPYVLINTKYTDEPLSIGTAANVSKCYFVKQKNTCIYCALKNIKNFCQKSKKKNILPTEYMQKYVN